MKDIYANIKQTLQSGNESSLEVKDSLFDPLNHPIIQFLLNKSCGYNKVIAGKGKNTISDNREYQHLPFRNKTLYYKPHISIKNL